MFDEQLQNDNYGYDKDYCDLFIYIVLTPQCSIIAKLRTFIYVPDMLMIKIIILIQSYVPRHFLQGKKFALCQ